MQRVGQREVAREGLSLGVGRTSAVGSSWIPPSNAPIRTAAPHGSSRRQRPVSLARKRPNAASVMAFHQTACGNPSRNSDPRMSAMAANRERSRTPVVGHDQRRRRRASSHGKCATIATMFTCW